MDDIKNLEINYNTVKKAEKKYKLVKALNDYSKYGLPIGLAILVSTKVNELLGNTSNNIVTTAGVLIFLSSIVMYKRYDNDEQIAKKDFENQKYLLEQKVLTK
jgi:hypothetical protein